MEPMSKAQECLIKCLRISGMDLAQIAEIVEMLWEDEATIEMLECLTQHPTIDQVKIFSMACEIAQKNKRHSPNPNEDRMCPIYGKVIAGELCYETALCMQGLFHISSVPESVHIKLKFADAKKVCSECPYGNMD